jgi:phosphoglucosamine mutase
MVPRFGTDGLRGVANTELTPELALALGRAVSRRVAGSPWLLGRDTRRSGPMLQAALAAGLASEGREVVDIGVIPTPGLAWLASSRGFPAAMISASHNPYADNGIKLLGPGGTKLPRQAELAVQDELDHASVLGARHGAAVGAISADPSAVAEYADHLVALVTGKTLLGGEIVVDCANGAASAVAPLVLDRLGVNARVINATPDGVNINAGCGSTHLSALAAEVVGTSAALGIAFDGDADRMLAVDHLGREIDGDYLIALFAKDLRDRGHLTGGEVVVTVMSNLGLHLALAAEGIAVFETPLGDRHVSDALEARGLVLGGEQSGHLIFTEHASSGDGVMTALLLLEVLGRTGASLAEVADAAMERVPQLLHNVPIRNPSRLVDAASVWAAVSDVESALGGSGRVLLRASGTESCVRIMVEAPTIDEAERHVAYLAAIVAKELGDA